jgi:hypothetical protein
VSGIRKQRQAVGTKTGIHLQHHEQDGCDKRPLQDLSGSGRVMLV